MEVVVRVGMSLAYAGGFWETVEDLVAYERAGLQMVFVPEAYSFDAVSQLGFIAARTEHLEIASGILQIYSRTPTLTAMTAAGLDHVSNGRFTLGLGASGPQVVEGFHGVAYHQPLVRTREVVEVCRKVWRREVLRHEGRHFTIPLPEGEGTGLGKPLRLINHPVRDRIPIMLAALGPRNVAQAAEIADGWEPLFYYPERADDVWGDPLREGAGRRDPDLGPLDVVVGAHLAIGDDVEDLKAQARAQVALYVGGMGARGRNFYNTLAQRYGFEREAALVQDHYLAGRKDDAAAAVPDELVDLTSLIGPEGFVRDRLAALRASGATTLNLTPVGRTLGDRLRDVETLRTLLA
ncbi:LLM class F420-dependent oxidoreductase [Nocardioides sp. 1609]|uniref:LLM class F420-dependent oxidoreductase n=1 Tax=Nocardioides sp. 1609 TaxID=2508327 RepID=UPI001FD67179|nr:LLM class F420-dependent oxidoreductase [Nocardioides sp. 1609]